jgi:putative nucleotidyltransferase with HDIG domain
MTEDQRVALAPFRQGVLESLPELVLIKNESLREACVDAWALALSETEFTTIDMIRGSGNWDTPAMRGERTQATHLRSVAMMAVGMARALEEVVGPIGIDYDVLLAAGLCHDLGKPFEFSPRNHARWRERPQTAGWPSVRHPVYGAHIALTAGLPEAVVNAVCGHSREGEFLRRSLETTLVHTADKGFWYVMTTAGEMESEETGYLKF